MIINCNVHNDTNATLSFKPNGSDTTYDLSVNDEKIKLASKNVFNITRLAYNDSGEYNCTISTGNTTDITEHQLMVLKEGKACMHGYSLTILSTF